MSDTDDLIKELANDCSEVQPMCTWRCFWRSLFVVFVVSGAGLYIVGVREDLFPMLEQGMFVAEILLAVATGVLASLAAHWLSTPDCKQQNWVAWLPFIPLTIGMFVIGYQVLVQPLHLGDEASSAHCAGGTAWFMAIPAVAMFFMLRVAATTRTLLTSFMAVLAVLSFSYLCMRLICANETLDHLLLWHYLPAVIFAIVGAIIGRMILRWK